MKHIQSQITDTMGVLLSPAAEPHPLGRGYGQDSSGPQRLPRSWILFWLCQAFAAGSLARPRRPLASRGFTEGFKKEESARASEAQVLLGRPLESHRVATLQLLQDLAFSRSVPQHFPCSPWCDRHTAIDK